VFPKRLLSLLLLLTIVAGVHAQQPELPLILMMDGDLYWVDGDNVLPLTRSGFASAASRSPDGQYVAYRDTPLVVREVYSRGGGQSGPQPSNVHMLDLETGREQVLTSQPYPAFYADPTQRDNMFARSAPVWSPDGLHVAWTNYRFDTGGISLGRYDLTSGVVRDLPLDLPEVHGIPSPLNVQWLNAGLAIRATFFDLATGIAVLQVRVYSPDNASLISVVSLDEIDTEPPYLDLFVNDDGADYYAQYDAANNRWILTDVLSGESYQTPFDPILVSSEQSASSLRFALGELVPYSIELDGQFNLHYQAAIYDADGATVVGLYDILFPDTNMSSVFAFAPGGQSAAYLVYDPLTRVYDRSQVFFTNRPPLTLPSESSVRGVLWGTQRWWLPADVTLETYGESDVFECPGALELRLESGLPARVLAGAPNRVRATPGVGGTVLGQIPAGGTFDVLGGPQCADGIVWWRVSYDTLAGWTAEGTDAYFVEPLR
jgi:hypothetical protein